MPAQRRAPVSLVVYDRTVPKQKPRKKDEAPDEDSKPHVKLIVIVAEPKES